MSDKIQVSKFPYEDLLLGMKEGEEEIILIRGRPFLIQPATKDDVGACGARLLLYGLKEEADMIFSCALVLQQIRQCLAGIPCVHDASEWMFSWYQLPR